MKKEIGKKIWDFLSCHQSGGIEMEHIRKAVILNLFVFLGSVFVSTIAVKSLLKHETAYAVMMITYMLVENATLWYFHRTKNFNVVAHLIILPVLSVIVYTFLKGSVEGNTILWFYMFPAMALFLTGIRWGLGYIIVLFTITFWFFKHPLPPMYHYSETFKERFAMSWLCTALFTFIFESVRQTTYNSFIAAREKQERNLSEINRQKEEITAHKDALQESNILVKTQNEKITAGLSYAKTIQTATLPPAYLFESIFKDQFIVYLPKDIVSGDFYWFHAVENDDDDYQNKCAYLAVCDCTGHGVPGALMSMIANRLLSEAVLENHLFSPAEILEHLDNQINQTLHQSTSENIDGMDVALCFIKKSFNTTQITFSGAKRNLIYCQQSDNSIDALIGERRSIGGGKIQNKASKLKFTNQAIKLKEGDSVYLYTDGFPDQCNDERERFGTTRLLDLLHENIHTAMNQQKEVLLSSITAWQQNAEQRDDITFLGLKI